MSICRGVLGVKLHSIYVPTYDDSVPTCDVLGEK
ncbi:hypothetical protein BE1S18E01_30830 [Acinetobacter sp. BEC1-S18-ESBL-01]|nr:hypothetical protein F922_03195 [Acinetobacter baumannii NIPH 201]SSO25821.1 Uncharacterised protein [Acinetobacter nosocomialis]SSV26805.1 Uncharacterised protein [Acinetobacter baumannii]SSW80097.1 Uncharacterised protein [Klebsiella pneumoniae]BBU19555.1 hypothetical protein BE1S18E01_30830 [Acinetobacter sp. BEC1-S18-ESBL-01]